MCARKREPIWLIIKDEDRKQYSVVGPMSNDQPWTDRVYEEQQKGRYLRCVTIDPTGYDEIAWANEHGLTKTSVEKILAPPEDMSSRYDGPLPGYAKNANRNRVVRILCKGKCRSNQWAEMNKDYPGKEELRKAEMFVYKAKCLKCGKENLDNYNWTR